MAEHQMTEREIERLAELISIKTSEKYLVISKECMRQAIDIHVINCQVGKYKKITAFISALIGGIIVTLVNWFIRRQ